MPQQLQQCNIHRTILKKFGRNAIIKYRWAESKTAALAKWRNHLYFNLSCKCYNVEPKSLLGPLVVVGEQADKILKTARRKLLRICIGQTQKNVNTIKAELDKVRPHWDLQT